MRPTRPVRAVVLLVAAGTLAAGCSDSAVGPERPQPAELARLLGEMALPALSGLASTLAPVSVPGLASPSLSGCAYTAASRSFVCPAVLTNGLTITQSYTLLDAAGTAQVEYGPSSTAAVRTNMRSTGTIAGGGGSVAVDQTQELTLSGLLAGAHLLNGTSVARVAASKASGTLAPFTSTTTSTISDLALPASAGAQPAWPTSGTITLDATVETAVAGVARGAAVTHALITFTGTSRVVVTFTTGGLTDRCTIDLAGQSAPACR